MTGESSRFPVLSTHAHGSDRPGATPLPALSASRGTSRAPVVLLPARIGVDWDADERCPAKPDGDGGAGGGGARRGIEAANVIGARAARVAEVFVEAGWDVGFYGTPLAPAVPAVALADSPRGAALLALAERTGHPCQLRYFGLDSGGASANAAAAGTIGACTAVTGFGAPARCLIVAPSAFVDPRHAVEQGGRPASAGPRSDTAHGTDGEEVSRFQKANLTIPLCLMSAQHAAWQAWRGQRSPPVDADAERFAVEDASILVLLDTAGLQRLVGIETVPYAASQAGLHATVPSLARAYAPGMRVSAVSAPLHDGGDRDERAGADAALAQALYYGAQASTITGATLRVGGVPTQVARSE